MQSARQYRLVCNTRAAAAALRMSVRTMLCIFVDAHNNKVTGGQNDISNVVLVCLRYYTLHVPINKNTSALRVN
jgi:hypothetical protein